MPDPADTQRSLLHTELQSFMQANYALREGALLALPAQAPATLEERAALLVRVRLHEGAIKPRHRRISREDTRSHGELSEVQQELRTMAVRQGEIEQALAAEPTTQPKRQGLQRLGLGLAPFREAVARHETDRRVRRDLKSERRDLITYYDEAGSKKEMLLAKRQDTERRVELMQGEKEQLRSLYSACDSPEAQALVQALTDAVEQGHTERDLRIDSQNHVSQDLMSGVFTSSDRVAADRADTKHAAEKTRIDAAIGAAAGALGIAFEPAGPQTGLDPGIGR